MDLVREGHVEAEEVDRLAGRVDLRLMRGLALAQHGGGVDQRAVLRRQQLGGLEEDGGALLERHRGPVGAGCLGRGDGLLDVRPVALVRDREDVLVTVGHPHLDRLAGADLLAADDQRDLDFFAGHALERILELRALGASRRVGEHGLVGGSRNPDVGLDHVRLQKTAEHNASAA